jgi:hypothetical protein
VRTAVTEGAGWIASLSLSGLGVAHHPSPTVCVAHSFAIGEELRRSQDRACSLRRCAVRLGIDLLQGRLRHLQRIGVFSLPLAGVRQFLRDLGVCTSATSCAAPRRKASGSSRSTKLSNCREFLWLAPHFLCVGCGRVHQVGARATTETASVKAKFLSSHRMLPRPHLHALPCPDPPAGSSRGLS